MLAHWFTDKLTNPLVWFGLGGQFVFMLRFVVQWFASERRGRSYVPIAFWYISVAGGLMLFTYAYLNRDPVIVLGQSLGLGIYLRNLYLIHSRRARYRRRRQAAQATSHAADQQQTPLPCPTDPPTARAPAGDGSE